MTWPAPITGAAPVPATSPCTSPEYDGTLQSSSVRIPARSAGTVRANCSSAAAPGPACPPTRGRAAWPESVCIPVSTPQPQILGDRQADDRAPCSAQLLGIFADNDRSTPSGESLALFKQALDRGHNKHYTFRVIHGASHTLHISKYGWSDNHCANDISPVLYRPNRSDWCPVHRARPAAAATERARRRRNPARRDHRLPHTGADNPSHCVHSSLGSGAVCMASHTGCGNAGPHRHADRCNHASKDAAATRGSPDTAC